MQTHEQKMLAQKVPFDVAELQRLYYDMQGLSGYSIDEIHKI